MPLPYCYKNIRRMMNSYCRTFQLYRIIRVLSLRFGISPCYCVSKGTQIRRDIREKRAVRNQFCLAHVQRCIWYRNCEDSVEMSHDVLLTNIAINCSCFMKPLHDKCDFNNLCHAMAVFKWFKWFKCIVAQHRNIIF